ncbi:MAG: hypothetical protein ACHREM_09650, partial [Polyangiales bacterium]
MLRSFRRLSALPALPVIVVLAAVAVAGCASSNKAGVPGTTDSGGVIDPDTGLVEDTGTGTGSEVSVQFDGGVGDTGTGTTIDKIYISTDTALYVQDPATNAVTEIGTFTMPSGVTGSITDVAVNGAGDVFVNTTTELMKATLPAGGSGAVALASVGAIGNTTTKFYALAFTPSDVLETGIESLIAGDGNGHLWLIPTATTSPGAPVDLGDFGAYASTDPTPSGMHTGDTPTNWGCSGDIVFWTDSTGTVHG